MGDGLLMLALPWAATVFTRDAFLIALVAACQRLPWLFLSIPVGVATDRFARKPLLMGSEMFRAVVLILLAVWVVAPVPNEAKVFGLAGLAFLIGAAEVLGDNVAQTAVPAVVGDISLETANGRLWSVEHIMNDFVGPPLAGLLLAAFLPLPFAVIAVLLLVAFVLVRSVRFEAQALNTSRQSPVADAKEGWRWLRTHPEILRLALVLGGLNFFATMTHVLLILISQERFGLNAFQHGLLLMSLAIGGVLAGWVMPKLVARIGQLASLRFALLLMPLEALFIAFAPNVWVTAAALFVGVQGAILWNVVTVAHRQRLIPTQLFGRVNSFYRLFGWGAIPLGALMGGAIISGSEALGVGRLTAVALPFWVAAIGLGAVAIYATAKLRFST